MSISKAVRQSRLKTIIIALSGAFVLMTAAGCYGPEGLSPRATGALAGGALGAGGGALIGSAMGAPGTGALIGGVGGALGGYALGNEIQRRRYYRDSYYPY